VAVVGIAVVAVVEHQLLLLLAEAGRVGWRGGEGGGAGGGRGGATAAAAAASFGQVLVAGKLKRKIYNLPIYKLKFIYIDF
jgi:hypothetical protein